jgi:DNA topoisomerase-3
MEAQGKTLIIVDDQATGVVFSKVLEPRGAALKGCALVGDRHIICWPTPGRPEKDRASSDRWRIQDLPVAAEFLEPPGTLRRLASRKDVSAVVIATRPDAEGERAARTAIGGNAHGAREIFRIWTPLPFTERSVREEMGRLRPDGNSRLARLAEAADAQRKTDRIIGVNATRAWSLALGEKTAVGRLTGPALVLLAEQCRATAKDGWAVRAEIRTAGGSVIEAAWNGLVPTRREAQDLAVALTGADGTVTVVRKEAFNEEAPFPFSLADLQYEAARILGFSPGLTLRTAMDLYRRHGAISWPLTESNRYRADLADTLVRVIHELSASRIEFDPWSCRVNPADGRLFTEEEHDPGAIVPVGGEPKNMGGSERVLYGLIVRLFLASLYPESCVRHVSIAADAGGGSLDARAIEIVNPGWRSVYPYGAIRDIAAAPEEGERITVIAARAEPVPSPPLETDILREMENRGIGTAAGRTAALGQLVKRGYAAVTSRNIRLGAAGARLAARIGNRRIGDPGWAAGWDRRYEDVASGSAETAEVLEEAMTSAETLVAEALEEKRIGDCPACGGPVLVLGQIIRCTRKSGKGGRCEFSLHRGCLRNLGRKSLTDEEARSLLAGREAIIHGLTGRSGKRFSAPGRLTRVAGGKHKWRVELVFGEKDGGASET